MHKNVLAIVVILIGVSVLGYFVYFSWPLDAPDAQVVADDTETEQIVDTSPVPPDREEAIETNTGQNSNETSIEPTSNTINITYTAAGFTPRNIEISAGTRVIFQNESTRPMWVASDPHPTHNLLPELDQGAPGPTGSEFEFVFNDTGAWGYHNHLIPSQKGTITVTN